MWNSALSRAQPEIIVSEIKNWQNSDRMQQLSESTEKEDATSDYKLTTAHSRREIRTVSSSGNWWGCKRSIPWRNAGILGSISYLSQESDEDADSVKSSSELGNMW